MNPTTAINPESDWWCVSVGSGGGSAHRTVFEKGCEERNARRNERDVRDTVSRVLCTRWPTGCAVLATADKRNLRQSSTSDSSQMIARAWPSRAGAGDGTRLLRLARDQQSERPKKMPQRNSPKNRVETVMPMAPAWVEGQGCGRST
jgi:hypothetical protein